jgi:hypothetical protein
MVFVDDVNRSERDPSSFMQVSEARRTCIRPSNLHEPFLKIGLQHMYVLVKLLVGCFYYRLKPTASL